MTPEELIMVCTSDIAGQVRGKALTAVDVDGGQPPQVPWTPTNIMITAHGPIADSPWGPLGDLMLTGDPSTHVRLVFGDGDVHRFMLGDLSEPGGAPWACCLRDFARRGLAALEAEFGLTLRGAMEHEFHYDGVEERPNSAYSLDALRRQGAFAGDLLAALREAGLTPESFMPEYGPSQYEVTVAPSEGLRIADEAVILREVSQTIAARHGGRVSFTPMVRPDAVGNGVHVHFSLCGEGGAPVNHDPDGPAGLSAVAGAFLAGILSKLPSLVALTAASTISYLRLVPNRWSASAVNLGQQDREAAVRLCPVFAARGAVEDQFHFEYRVADGTASPYLLLGALVWAGLHGLRQDLPAPPVTEENVAEMSGTDRAALGIQALPTSLSQALDSLAADDDVIAWMGQALHEAYQRHKRFEVGLMADLDPAAQCARYHLAY